jgi:GNAT superfamily N-acetyltransferase
VAPPLGELNRFFYTTIGGEWFWVDRRNWTAAQWAAHVARTGELETWVLAVEGVPAGYVELERRAEGAVELAYVGLLPAFVGQGLGAHLVTCGIEAALAVGATRVLVETCNLDHPAALANYVARGFREIRVEVKQKELPATAPRTWEGVTAEGARALLRHTVAVVAYRGGKALRGAPASFAHFKVADTSREPIRILAHIGDLYDWALSMAIGKQRWADTAPTSWDEEVARFSAALRAFDDYLASNAELHLSAERLFAGPIADSLTHVGQLTMLRRVAGAPIKGENYSQADIVAGRVGADQAVPKKEFG